MITAVVTRQSGTPEGVANRINGLLGKRIQSPRDDYPGEFEVFNVLQVQIVQLSLSDWYGFAVVEIGIDKEILDVEEAFFGSIETEA